jgi:hypothetical protein
MTGKVRRPVVPQRPAPRPAARPAAAPASRSGGALAVANRVALLLVLAFFAFLVLYITYEFGRYNGSYDRLAVSQLLSERDVQIERLEAANRQARTQLEELKTIDLGRPAEEGKLKSNIEELQTQIARMSQELIFYRGVMAKPPTELGVRLGEVHIEKGRRPGLYMVHVALLRTGRPDDTVQGTLTLHIDSDKGKVADLSDLTGGRKKDLPYNLKYYANIDQEVSIPGDFKPLHLGVDVHSVEKDVPPLAQTYVWAEIGGEPATPPVPHR